MARAIGNDRVIVAFEPDSLGTIQCQAKSRRDDRYRLLRYGVDAISELPNVTMYLEAGASDWENAKRTAKQLRRIGIAKVRGFMLNATHYDWTAANIEHGLEISRLTGRQALHHQHGGERPRAGALPQLDRSQPPQVAHDQHLVQPGPARPRPAADHGHVQPDGGRLSLDQPAGLRAVMRRPQIAWFPPRAFAYARWATNWERPPRGTRYGHYKRYPLERLRHSVGISSPPRAAVVLVRDPEQRARSARRCRRACTAAG